MCQRIISYIQNSIIYLFIFFYCTTVSAQTPGQRQTAQSFATTTYTQGLKIGYYEYLPENYSSGSNFPVVIFLHGMGEKGNGTTDLQKVKITGPPKMIDDGKNFGFICITPQANWPHDWKPELIDEIVEMVKAKYKIDVNRIYLTGLSMGGAGTFDYAGFSKSYANKLAAIVPMAGWLSQTACNMNTLPIWGFQGGNDGSGTINAINGIKSCNPAPVPTPLITVYPNVGHNCWDLAYNDQKMWDWLLNQKKSILTTTEAVEQNLTVDCYPNPAQDQIHVNFNLPNHTSLNINWINSDGQTIDSYIINGNSGKNEIILQTYQLNNGLYLLQIDGSDISFSRKINILK